MSEQNSNMPPWAKKVDDYGKRHWHKDKPVKNRIGEYIATIIWNLIWWYIVNHVREWDLKFINEHYSAVIWALNMNIYIQIAGNFLMLVFNVSLVRYLCRIILEAANFLVMIIIYYIYPFDFSQVHGLTWLDWFIPLILIIGMVVSALKVLSNIWKLIFWRD